jgi:hypothetical protein
MAQLDIQDIAAQFVGYSVFQRRAFLSKLHLSPPAELYLYVAPSLSECDPIDLLPRQVELSVRFSLRITRAKKHEEFSYRLLRQNSCTVGVPP